MADEALRPALTATNFSLPPPDFFGALRWESASLLLSNGLFYVCGYFRSRIVYDDTVREEQWKLTTPNRLLMN